MIYLNDNRLRAEFFGTLCLVLIGCSSMVLTGFNIQLPLGFMAIGMAFGMTYAVMIYALGPISGCHLNPAVTAAMWSAGRINSADAIAYVITQFIGAIVGALILYLIISGRSTGWDPTTQGLGQNGWQVYGMTSAIIAEFVGTLIFTTVILAVTGPKGNAALAGLAIGLTLMIVHFAFIAVSGAGVNPARSFAPALFAGSKALSQVWMYLIVPTLGGLAAGWLVKSKTLDF
ncbi:MAG: aquaporin [Xanthobacteraceae bacterium]